MKTIAFFNNKGGVGTTTLVYHLAWMIADRGESVLVVDLDPQANLSSMFLSDDQMEALWTDGVSRWTMFGALRPIIRGFGDVATPHVEKITPNLGLVVGDLALSTFDDTLSDLWPCGHARDESALRSMTAIYRGVQQAAGAVSARWVLIDVGPNLGAINRAALLASDHVIIPIAPDFFSLQALRSFGPWLQSWRENWTDVMRKSSEPMHEGLGGSFEPLGYVVMQHGMRESRSPKGYQRWLKQFPRAYRESVLQQTDSVVPIAAEDPYCLAVLRHYRSLMTMATEARKPVFSLKAADGAIGAHADAAQNAYREFLSLAKCIVGRTGVSLP